MNLSNDIEDKVAQVLGSRPLVVELMQGATSSDLYLLEASGRNLVLRLFKEERWDSSPESLTTRESNILSTLSGMELPTPSLVANLPDNGVLMSWLPGRVWLPQTPTNSWLEELATSLTRIHQSSITVPYAYESWNDIRGESAPTWWDDPELWDRAQTVTASPPAHQVQFIHRDYHPVNVLWEGDRISGVVDWINACMGPAGIDVAHCRSNLALMYGLSAADDFLSIYQDQNPHYLHEVYWDLDDALGALPDLQPYAPWETFGLVGLSVELIQERFQSYLDACVSTRLEK